MGKRNLFVEIGRVVQINHGPNAGKIATIIDVVDQSRALIDSPALSKGVPRQTIPFKCLSLTPIKVKIGRGALPSSLKKAYDKEKVLEAYQKTNWAKKANLKDIRSNLSDFGRFKLMILKKKKNRLINKEFAKLRKAKLAANKK